MNGWVHLLTGLFKRNKITAAQLASACAKGLITEAEKDEIEQGAAQ